MTSLFKRIILLSSLLSLICIAQWKQTNGPENGTIGKVYSHNNLIFALSNTYLFRSSDFGATWEQVKNGLPEKSVLSFTAKGSYLFVGASEGSVYQSNDLGKTWTASFTGPGVKYFAQSSTWSGDTLLLGGFDQDLSGNRYYRIYSSTNFGTTWSIISDLSLKSPIFTIHSKGALIIAGTESQGMYVSTNFGASWNFKNQGLALGSIRTVCPIDSYYYAATDSGLFRTKIDSWNWELADTSLAQFSFNDVFPFGKKIFATTFERILVSENHWKEWNHSLYKRWITNFFSFTNIGSMLFVGTSRTGVLRSDDSGKTWNSTGAMVKRISITNLSSRDSILLACSSDGVYESSNDGASWRNLNTDTVDGAYFVKVNKSHYFAGNYWGLFRMKRNEKIWRPILFNHYVTFMYLKGDSIYAGTMKGLFFSPNNGETVSILDSTLSSNLSYIQAMVVQDSNIVIAGGGSLLISRNHGTTWTKRELDVNAQNIVRLYQTENVFYAFTRFGSVYKTILIDTSWTKVSAAPGFSDGLTLAIKEKNLFMSSSSGVFYSTNFGEKWTNAGNGGFPFYNTFSVEVTNDKLFVGMAYYGIWYRNLSDIIANVEQHSKAKPEEYVLSQNYPNPFNPSTRIEYHLPTQEFVTLKIFDLLGRETITLVNEVKSAGSYSVQWNSSQYASGVYFAKLQSGTNVQIKKMILIK